MVKNMVTKLGEGGEVQEAWQSDVDKLAFKELA